MMSLRVNKNRIFKGFLIILAICNFHVSTAQFKPQNDKMNYYNLGKKFYAETYFLPSETADSLNVFSFFRFTYDMISFEKSGILNSNINNFYSIPKLEVEFKDSEGIIRHREVWQDTIFSDNFEKTISKKDFIFGAFQCKLAFNSFDVDIRLSDKNIQAIKKFSLKDTVKNFYSKPTIGNPIFAEMKETGTKRLIPFILKNKIEFSSNTSILLIPVSFENDFSKFFYSCRFLSSLKKSEFKWKSGFNINSVVIPEKNATIGIVKNDITGIEISTSSFEQTVASLKKNNAGGNDKTSEKNLIIGVLHITFPPEEIVPGEYELKVVESGSNDTMTYLFDVIWEDMPVILQKPKYAIESMYYILKDDEYKKMLDADEENYSFEILNYWQNQDPTKFTPFNESMAEYFKRVDYAMFNFRTLNEANGIKTDRGKIYILYGPATSTERNLTENNALEIWKYEHLKKMFIFETLANDVFKLIDIKAY